MDNPYEVDSDIAVLPTHLDIPGVGTLLVNAFVLKSEQPVLVDTGIGMDSDSFIEALRSVVDLRDLRWIWVTHDDVDHTGSLPALMQAAPHARLATHALGALRMSTWFPLDLDRVHAISPGATIDVGDRTLRGVMPPTFDNPTSTALHDESTSTLFCVDAFGAIVPRAVTSLDDLTADELIGGMTAWTTFDSPWTHLTDRSRFGQVLDGLRALAPRRVLSAHLPPAVGRLEQLLGIMSSVPDADPFQAPDAKAFAQIAAALAAAPASA
jgi:glyoxylase-like metal-dependent hydrolase (beta-lactamase superfamily II)